jgi:hypothetical protein
VERLRDARNSSQAAQTVPHEPNEKLSGFLELSVQQWVRSLDQLVEDAMSEIDLLICRLELRIEQQRIHIQMLANDAHQASDAEGTLEKMLEELAVLREKRRKRDPVAA